MLVQPKSFRGHGYRKALPKTFHTYPDIFENGDFSPIRFSLLSIPYVNSLRAVARKKLQPRRTHGPLYEISRMKSSNIISLIKKIKIDSIW